MVCEKCKDPLHNECDLIELIHTKVQDEEEKTLEHSVQGSKDDTTKVIDDSKIEGSCEPMNSFPNEYNEFDESFKKKSKHSPSTSHFYSFTIKIPLLCLFEFPFLELFMIKNLLYKMISISTDTLKT